jgi:hypothetical protein
MSFEPWVTIDKILPGLKALQSASGCISRSLLRVGPWNPRINTPPLAAAMV